MNKNLPILNKIVSKKWKEYENDVHKKKLHDIKNRIRPRIDSSPPPSFKHLADRKKQEQLMEERFTEIEKENRILLEKVTQMMKGIKKSG